MTQGPVAGEAGPPPEQRLERAVEIIGSGENLLEAYRLLRKIEADDLRSRNPGLLDRYWWALGWACYELGRYHELDTVGQRLLDLARSPGHASARLHGLYYQAAAVLGDEHGFDPRNRAIALMTGVVEAAGPRDQHIRMLALLALAKLHPGERGAVFLEQARAIAESQKLGDTLFHIRVEEARRAARTDPAAGHALLEEAVRAREDHDDPWSIYGWEARLEIIWAARPREEALKFSLDLLDRIEVQRKRQQERGSGSMGFFSVWARAYGRVAGLLLRGGETSRAELELAFRLSEAMRARVLLEELEAMGARSPGCGGSGALERLAEVRRGISRRQRLLLTGPEDSGSLMREIADLMLDEEAITREGRCPAGEAKFVDLPEVERALRPDEAMLVFQMGNQSDVYGGFDGGSWLMVVTAGGTTFFSLPDNRVTRMMRDALLGAIRRRDGSDAGLAAIVHDHLLRPLPDALPPGITHLIVVPHGSIHGLPLAILRPEADAPPLVERCRLSYVPSATLWWRWRKETGGAARSDAIALADPELVQPKTPSPAPPAAGLTLHPLPGARSEARRLLHAYPGQARLIEGAEATEGAFRKAARRPPGLVLFATHAVVDPASPRRSSIMLAAGGDSEDGMLQPPEIATLALGGAIVALSGCQSAAGAAPEGEGVLSLARSFFEAGSKAVIGNLWPARDREAAELFGGIYERLAGGDSLAEALRREQMRSWKSGRPAEAWAGVVVMGDGGMSFPAAGAAPGRRWIVVALMALSAGALAFLGRRVAQHARRPPSEGI